MNSHERKIIIFIDGRASLPLTINEVRQKLALNECKEQDLSQWMDGDEWLPLHVLLKEEHDAPATAVAAPTQRPVLIEDPTEESGGSKGIIGFCILGIAMIGLGYYLWSNGITGIKTGTDIPVAVSAPPAPKPTNETSPAVVPPVATTNAVPAVAKAEIPSAVPATPIPPAPTNAVTPPTPPDATGDELLLEAALAIEQDKLPEARELIERAEALRADRKELLKQKIALYRLTGEVESELKALRLATAGFTKSDTDPAFLLRFAQLMLQNVEQNTTRPATQPGIYEARMALRKYLELEPDSLDGHMLMGLCAISTRSWNDATTHYEAAQKQAPENPEVLSALLALAIRKKDAVKASQLGSDLQQIDQEAYAPYAEKVTFLAQAQQRAREETLSRLSDEYREKLRNRYNLTTITPTSEIPRTFRGIIYVGGTITDEGRVVNFDKDLVFGALNSTQIRFSSDYISLKSINFAQAYRDGNKISYMIVTLPAGLLVFRDSARRDYPLIMQLIPDSGEKTTQYYVYIN
ncbi:MAG: hypothetical protein ACAI35_19635 [Candidatus Methylacidiphilales bacterium]|nr:hypothetical protein [Candidatus Methylacidiphilales bacterium]